MDKFTTIEELNAFIAEHIMGLKPQVDFGEWEEHDWKRNENGKIDMFAFDYEYHNGPICKRCGYSYCIHCVKEGSETIQEKCHIDPPNYSSYLDTAWDIIEKLRSQGYKIEIKINEKLYTVTIFNPNTGLYSSYSYEKLPMAICLVAVNYHREKNK